MLFVTEIMGYLKLFQRELRFICYEVWKGLYVKLNAMYIFVTHLYKTLMLKRTDVYETTKCALRARQIKTSVTIKY